MPLRLLVDTSVWLDLAKDYRYQPVISALEDLISEGQIELLIPQVVLDEFARNKDRVAADAARSLKSHFSLVRDAVTRFGEAAAKDAILKMLDDVDHAAIVRGEAVNASISRVEKLLGSAAPMPTTDALKARVTDRAIAGRAPYHRSIQDAMKYSSEVPLNYRAFGTPYLVNAGLVQNDALEGMTQK
jgi:predicted nucleic acid-binding protein